ncbi:MAG: right-handed parallel beta-helix repeat-containing protein [Sedimentisphaerales bacterium]|nr:right-handed parallel beta-helix repeat-containing protein [Sedimentisphaerales bacterium]
MASASVCAIVLALIGAVPGETTGWGSGDVVFRAYVRTSEHQEIYPVCAGEYTVEVVIDAVLEDRMDVLDYVTKVDVCYNARLNLAKGELIEVRGTYHDGACPFAFCGRVEASSVSRAPDWEPPEPPDEPNDIESPSVSTDSAEATETTVTLHGTLEDDGGDFCRCRFTYKTVDGPWWTTEWITGQTAGASFSQKVAALAPGTRYYYYAQADNSIGWTSGRQGMFFTLEEKVPPIPHPAVWVSGPGQIDTTSIAMVADIERDVAAPEEYAFDFVGSPTGGAGGSDSVWQFSPMYTDVGLNPNQQYGYRVKARDGHGNETAYSPIRYEYTDIETPEGVSFGQITTTSVQVKSSGILSGLTRGQSGLKLENTAAGQVSAWQQENAYWTSDGLLPNTRYTFRAQARNGDGDLTGLSKEGNVYTLAIVPTPVTFAGVAVNQLCACWGSNGNPAGTQYWCENTVSGRNSGWTTSTQWLDTGLSPNVKYTYRVKARNGDGVETAYCGAVSTYSAIETPTGIVVGTVTSSSVQVQSRNTPSNLAQGESGLWFENVSTGQTSSWRRDNAFWTSDGLLPNRAYGFRVRARNGDAAYTPHSDTLYTYTYANVPGPAAFTGITAASIQVQWGTGGNPVGTLYLCENTTAGMNSGWTTDTTWFNTGLTPNTSYTYRVKARNGDGVETAWMNLGSQSTEYRSLTISASAGGEVTAPGQGVVRCAPGATIDLVATPLGGYHFLRWTGSAIDAGRVADPNAAQTTVLVDAHYTLTANFLRTRIYVDKRAVGTKDGSSWKNAFVTLQDALDVAQVGNEIRVAQGVYKPDAGRNVMAGDRLAFFEFRSHIALRGGYAGLAQADPNARDITAYETILSGDLKGDDRIVSDSYDLYNETSRADNSYHVMIACDVDDTTLLEGVTITAGNGIDGAGLCLIRSHPLISQCTFRANRAGQLSGDGLVGWGEGAAVSCYQSRPTFSKCAFLRNWAGGLGAGVFGVESSPTLTNCTFQDNEAGLQGGAMFGEDCNSVWIDCTFHANWSGDGGAVCSTEASDSRITGCRFLGNAARGLGGAVFDAGQSLEITNSLFSGNMASDDGGAVALAGGPALLTNCTFNRNVAEGEETGQALAVRDAVATVANCVFWDHVDAALAQIALTRTVSSTELAVSFCDVLNGASGVIRRGAATIVWGEGNVETDPRFRDPAGADHVAGTADDDLHVRPGSPCVDAGDDTAVPMDDDDLNANGNRAERVPYDLDGQPRFVDHADTPDTGVADAPLYPAVVDIGAYELSATAAP